MENWFLHGNIILVSMVKYIIGTSLAVIYVSPIMGFFLTFIGGLTGVLLFTWGGFWIKAAFGRLKFSKNPGKKKNHSKLFLWLKNNGNIGIPLWNTGKKVEIVRKGEKIAQGIFETFLTTLKRFILQIIPFKVEKSAFYLKVKYFLF
jgi:hypothetical protein